MNGIANCVRQHLDRLSAIGSRPVGSPSIHQAESYIHDVFRKSGLAVEHQKFSCYYWDFLNADLKMDGESLPVIPNTFAPSCDVSAPSVALATVGELEKSDLKGKIAVLYGSLSAETLAAKNFAFWNPEEHRKIVGLLEDKKPDAIITISPRVFNPVPIIEDWDFEIPSVTVTAKAGLPLLRNAGKRIALNLASELKQSRSANVIARTDRPVEKRVVICAHYDTKYSTAGIFDNASGTAALLALAKTLGLEKLPVNLEFIAFASEEYYALGELAYLEKYEAELANIAAAINIDGVGLFPSHNSVAFFDWPDDLAGGASNLTARNPAVVQVDPWPQGDHTIFWMQGIPCVAFSADLGSKQIADLIQTVSHTEEDTMDWVSPEKVAEVVGCVQELVAMI